VAVDGQGNVYIADFHARKKWTAADNSVTTLLAPQKPGGFGGIGGGG
jgi:hypothetical protein